VIVPLGYVDHAETAQLNAALTLLALSWSCPMKIIQIVPQAELPLYTALVKKEAELRKKNRGTFYRTARKRNSSKWRHRAYSGWMNLERGLSEVDLAEIHAPAPDQEWQLLSAFLGFIDRHFGKRVLAITIHYR
jgi:hypothetical protein